MAKEMHSIFNHTLAPITPGPSSSNTCGPVRIGNICKMILKGSVQKAVIEYASHGAFPSTLYGMRSDYAFVNGLLGKDQNTKEFLSAYEIAKKEGMEIVFKEVTDLHIGSMETVRIRLTDKEGNELVVIAESLGGGSVCTHFIGECPIIIDGTSFELLVFSNAGKEALELIKKKLCASIGNFNACDIFYSKEFNIINIKASKAFDKSLLEELENAEDIVAVREVSPIHPVVLDVSRKLPFESPEEMIAYCAKNNLNVAQAAINYEMAVSGWTEEEIRKYADMLLEIMENSCKQGLDPELEIKDGIISPKAHTVMRAQEKGLPSLGLIGKAIPYALAVMEFSNAGGKIVCVPTGGSSGIVPAMLLAAKEEVQLSADEMYHALMVGGIVGVLMMVDGNEFSGVGHGCQAEIACGSAMAAAALVHIMKGDAQQVCDAASMCLQSFLGLVCDPVAGLVQVPCIARNISGLSVACSSAYAVVAGFDVVLPLSETTKTMVRVGAEIADTLGACTNGACMSPTGKCLAEKQRKRVEEAQKS